MKKITIIFLFSCSSSVAQQAFQLHDAINIALKNSLDIQLSKNDVEANKILNNYGVAGGLPLVSGSTTNSEQVTSINQKYSDATRNTQRNNAASNVLNAG